MKRWRVILLFIVELALVAAAVYLTWPAPNPEAEPDELHTDDQIRRLVPYDIAVTSISMALREDMEPFDVPCLGVVPEGESYPRDKVFQALKIDDKRIGDFRHSQINFVIFLTWQVSPSYDISCMTAINDPENKGLRLTDPKRKVYGIRLLKRFK